MTVVLCHTVEQSCSSYYPRRCTITTLIETAASAPNGGFVHIRNYTAKTSGEVAHHTINGSVSWEATLLRSLEALSEVTAQDVADNCSDCEGDLALAKKALDEVRASYQKSYDKIVNDEGSDSNYEYLAPGVATLPNDDTLFIWGLCMRKEVVTPGEYKKVNSRPKTLVKKYIQRLTPASKFRRYKLTEGTYEYVSINGEKI